MKLWTLEKKTPGMDDPWGYDCAYAFVIRAEDEAQARQLASDAHGDEGAAVWLNPDLTACRELLATGEPAVVIQDFLAG